jgi:hypothetical protein
VLAHVDFPVPSEAPVVCEVVAVDPEQLPEPEVEPETEELLVEPEMLQLLAFAICIGDITLGMRSTVKRANTAPIENANLCILLVYKAIIYLYCKIILNIV